MNRIRVLIVESSSTSRQTLNRLLRRNRELEVVGAVASGRLALAQLKDLKPDVIVLDVCEPEREGLKTLGEIRKADSTVRVIILSELTVSEWICHPAILRGGI
jgi:chemotaxis response regulator CheB